MNASPLTKAWISIEREKMKICGGKILHAIKRYLEVVDSVVSSKSGTSSCIKTVLTLENIHIMDSSNLFS